MIASIYDNPQEKGFDLEFDWENGIAIKIFMNDECAEQFVKIITNKLNGRF